MELRHLEVFVAVAERGTLTAAAASLHLVQSGVSTTLRALERELGAALFTRTARAAVLTDAGRALLPEARAVLAAAQHAREVVRDVEAGLRGSLSVGNLTSMQLVDLPGLLARFQAAHPLVAVSLRAVPDGSRGLLRAVAAGELDLAFVSPTGRTAPGVRLHPLAEAPMQLLVPAGHRLAGRGPVHLGEVAGERWVDSPEGFGNRAVVDEAFERAGARRAVGLELVDVSSVPEYVAAGLGVGFVPGFVPRDEERVAVVPLRGEALRWPLSLARGTARPPRRAVAAFADAVVRGTAHLRAGTG